MISSKFALSALLLAFGSYSYAEDTKQYTTSDGFGFLVSKASDDEVLCATALGKPNVSAHVVLRRCEFTKQPPASQLWHHQKNDQLVSAKNQRMCLAVTPNGKRLRTRRCNDSRLHLSTFQLLGGDGWLQLGASSCVGVVQKQSKRHDALQTRRCKKDPRFLWEFVPQQTAQISTTSPTTSPSVQPSSEPTLPPSTELFSLMMGKGIPGSSIHAARTVFSKGTTMPMAVELCAQKCLEMLECVAFTVVGEDFRYEGSPAKCYPKSAIRDPELVHPTKTGLVVSGSLLTAADSFRMMLGYDMVGSDIPDAQTLYKDGTSLDTATNLCAQDCLDRPDCVAFTVVGQGFFHDGRAKCYPKNSIPSLSIPSENTLLVVSGRPFLSTDSFRLRKGRDFEGGEIEEIEYPKGTSLTGASELCAKSCLDLSDCVAFTVVGRHYLYRGSQAKCHLKHTVPNRLFVPPGNSKLVVTGRQVTPADSFRLILGRDFLGADIPGAEILYPVGTTLKEATNLCAQSCLDRSDCAAFTLVGHGFFFSGSLAKCHLKSSIPALEPVSPSKADLMVSGEKKAGVL